MIIFILVILCIVCIMIIFNTSEKILKEDKKSFKWFGFSIFMLVFAIPFLINEIYKFGYKIEKSYSTLWEAKDVLSFYGSFLSFLGTVALGALALWQNKKSNDINVDLLNLTKETERKSVLPFLSFNQYIPNFNGNLIYTAINSLTNEGEVSEDNTLVGHSLSREDKLINEINCVISENKISMPKKLTSEQQQKIKSVYGVKRKENKVSICESDYLYSKICVQNCGRNSAINANCRLYKEGSEGTDNFDIYSNTFTIPLGETFNLSIYIDLKNKFKGEYILQFIYSDIYSNKYTQKLPLSIDEDSFTIYLKQHQKLLKN